MGPCERELSCRADYRGRGGAGQARNRRYRSGCGMKGLVHGSLCTGYGGLDMAAHAVFGGSLAWWSDIEPGPVALMGYHHPCIPNIGDLREVDWSGVPGVDVLTAGYPCQPFSNAGKRLGTQDPVTSGPGSGSPLGYFDSESCCWRTSPRTCDEASTLSARTWPRWVIASRSGFFPLPPPERLTSGKGSTSLLKTLTAQLAVNGGSQHPDKRKAGGHGPTLADEVEWLLPTPKASDGAKGGPNMRGSAGDPALPMVAVTLLPAPIARDWKPGTGSTATNSRPLNDVIDRIGFSTPTRSGYGNTSSGVRRRPRP